MENSEKTISFKPDLNFNCLSFFAAGVGRFGIRNNCPSCMTAVINWTPTVGVKQYNVAGQNQIIINMESSNAQLIGEQPC